MERAYRVPVTPEQEDRVQRLQEDTFIFDGLATYYLDKDYVKKLRAVGVNAIHYTVGFNSLMHGHFLQDNFVMTCQKIGRWYRILEECQQDVALATSIVEMEEITKNGRIAVFFGFQNGSPLEDNLDYLHIFYRLGVRFIMLTYNTRNFIGSGSGERVDSELSDFGVRVVKEMNKLGMAVDLSHCGYQTTLDAIQCSDMPVLFTHANVQALADTTRNKTDDLICLLAEKGGVMGIKSMLGNTKTKLAEETTVADVVDQIEYVANLVGIDHVALGTDFPGTVHSLDEANAEINFLRTLSPKAYLGKRIKPAGFETIDGLPNVTRELVKRGYSDEDIAKIYGKNLIRVLRVIFRH